MKPEDYYRLRFYLFLASGAVVSIFYIVTLGLAFNIAQKRTEGQIRAATEWHKREYEKAWDYRHLIMKHIQNHDRAIERDEALAKANIDLLQRIEILLKAR